MVDRVGSQHVHTQAFTSYWVHCVVFRPTSALINHNLVEEKHNVRFLKRLCAAAAEKKNTGIWIVRFRTDTPLLNTYGSPVILNSIKNCHRTTDGQTDKVIQI